MAATLDVAADAPGADLLVDGHAERPFPPGRCIGRAGPRPEPREAAPPRSDASRVEVTEAAAVAAVTLKTARASLARQRRCRLADRRRKDRADDVGREGLGLRCGRGLWRSGLARRSSAAIASTVSPLSMRSTSARAFSVRRLRNLLVPPLRGDLVADFFEALVAGGIDAGHVEPDIAAVARAQRFVVDADIGGEAAASSASPLGQGLDRLAGLVAAGRSTPGR